MAWSLLILAYKWLRQIDDKEVTVTKVVRPIVAKPSDLSKDTNTKLLGDNKKLLDENKDLANNSKNEITHGGPRIMNITVQKFFDNLNINSHTLPEALGDVEQQVLRVFAGVLAQGAVST